MFGSALLEVIIGLAFIYTLLSLVSSACNEVMAEATGLRGVIFVKAIARLLPTKPQQERFFKHVLIQALSREDDDKVVPSYVPRHTFALVVLDMAARGVDEPAPEQPLSAGELRQRVAASTDKLLRESLLPLIDAADNDIDVIRENVARWFDDTMDRASGWYKRRCANALRIISTVVVITVNADTLAIAKHFWNDPNARAAVSMQTQEFIKAENEREEGSTGQWVGEVAKIEKLELPIGWSEEAMPTSALDWLSKLAGLLISMLAVSQGAPFWFELLNKIVSMRAAGKVPENKKK
ncbi:MAG: hypothetical protein KC636_34195 [Myxococcales bacterium]|nr:hypothetical protein [Myxococcales bacterium]